ncbi:MAG: prepilin-type N-terminal cleavage/methylation domain-containing protein [Steroidobacteraceae bacterium]
MSSHHSHRAATGGFTLVELVVVIVLLGVLAAFALPRFLDLRDEAERATIESLVGSIKSARTLAFADFKTRGQLPSGYVGPQDFTLWNLVRCDSGEAEPRDPSQPGGHYVALGSLRSGLFRDPDQMACAGNTIQFVTQAGHAVTISGAGGAVSWNASPAY